ncbi:MAG: DUF3553 domain-containing protein [Leucothrix sp.]
MFYRKGDKVRHPIKDDWGLGKVLANSNGEKVDVFFVDAGEKTILLKYVQPVKVKGDESNHGGLDNLKVSTSGAKYQRFSKLTENFLSVYADGFDNEKFVGDERAQKTKAHELAVDLLPKARFAELIDVADYTEITARVLKILNATSLILPNERLALKNGLAEERSQEMFAKALFGLLYSDGPMKEHFERFATVLGLLGAGKWTLATYFLFVFYPKKHLFVKPKLIQQTADICRFELNYKAQLNWQTYESVLSFADYIATELSELKPKDMMDVNAFIWHTASAA